MFGKSDYEKKAYIIYHLRLCDINAPNDKVRVKLHMLYKVIKYELLDDYSDSLKNKYKKLIHEFAQFDDISIENAFMAEGSELSKLYKLFLRFEKKEKELTLFFDNELTMALRLKYGFNPLEDNDALKDAILLEYGEINIHNALKSPAL